MQPSLLLGLLQLFFGSLPYLFTGTLESFTDAYFEAMSGFTTTGATVIADVESLSKGILFWRSITQWIGGMGNNCFFLSCTSFSWNRRYATF